jgi:hypothetical protein
MPGNDAGIDVVAAADVAADDEIDGLAGVEIRGRRGSCHEDGDQRKAAAAQHRSLRRHSWAPSTNCARSSGV